MLNREDYCLRPMLERDLEQVLVWRNSDRIRSCMYTDEQIAWENHCNWYQKTLDNPHIVNQICEFQDRPIGVVNATQIDRYNSRCLWGFYLGDTTVPKGSSYIMGLLFLDWIFSDLSLRKVCGEVLSFNEDSIRYHDNLGFEREGILKEHIFKQGKYTDTIVFGLLADRWQQERSKTAEKLFSSIAMS
jgi:UDP-4-amino-4,6-dideoxy-N-acetyl-beta-L-altrosamine N-acetyltransferase